MYIYIVQLGSRQNGVWQLPSSGLTAAKIGFGSLAAATLGSGSCHTLVW